MSKPKKSPDRPLRRPKVRLSGLRITDYKAIDHLDLSLPAPTLPGTPDVFVLGSKNGVGKTSVLECAALAMLGAVHPTVFEERWDSPPPPYDQLIRAGAASATIIPTLEFGDRSETPTNELHPTKLVCGEVPELSRFTPPVDKSGYEQNVVESLLGRTSEPFLLPPLLSFHSYRKVAEGRVELSALVEPQHARRHGREPIAALSMISVFKVTLIRALMQQSGLFEARAASPASDETLLTKLNSLIFRYAGGAVKKLGASTDNRIDLRITPTDGGASYSFDGLSSGQKEIIATMFLIWFTTLDQPSVVLIDEPELHLNPEWQRSFVHDLTTLAPDNQYILATHAEEIFGSVPAEHRLMLSRED